MRTRHLAPHVVKQRVIVRSRGGRSGRGGGARTPKDFRKRVTKAFSGVFGGTGALGHHRPVRLDAQLTPEQMWQVYVMCGDVRAAVDSITRRVSTQDWRVVPTADPSVDSDRYLRGLEQAAAVTAALTMPNEDDDWRTFVAKVSTDALVMYHGAIELAYGTRVLGRGPIEEFATPHGPTIHPIANEHGRILGYVQEKHGPNGYFGAGDNRNGLTVLSKDQIILLRLNPNTRSLYPVPIIETIIREVTTLVRASERTMYTMDRHEVPTGFLILTGMPANATDAVKEAATHNSGRDDNIRILHTMGGTAPVQWVRVQEDFKEIQYAPVIKESRHVVWRNFGVTPIEMGDDGDKTRTSSTIQLEVGNSHLVEPLLEAWTQLVNSRMVGVIVEREENSVRAETLCRFEFVGDEGLSPEDEKLKAEAAKIRLESGQTTLNEERAAENRPRYAKGGDVGRVGGIEVGIVGDDDGDAAGEIDSDDADAMEEERCGPRCLHGEDTPHSVWELLRSLESEARDHARERRQRELLPSDWQPEGRFRSVRTMDLSALFDEVVAYRVDVTPLWATARSQVLAATGAAWRANNVGTSDHLRKVGAAIDSLREVWSAATRARYLATSEVGAQGARDLTEDENTGADSEQRALTYHDQAMAFLNALMDDVRTRVIANIQAVRVAHREAGVRAPQKADPDLGPESGLDDLLEAVERSFDANEFRIDNWTGRLVELGNLSMAAGMVAAIDSDREPGEAEIVEPETEEPLTGDEAQDGTGADEWWVQWVSVLDEGTCATCEIEASLGFRPATTLTTVPGGRTECRARCRCVLVWWKRSEVESGEAILL
jgi:hypothetical protein